MIKPFLFLTALVLVQAVSLLTEVTEEDSCEYLDNGCPADFDTHKLLPHETSCRKYYHCVRGEKVLRRCAQGLVFNPVIENCDRPGSINRECIEDSSSKEDLPGDQQPGVIDFLPNGCPVNHSINWHLPHEHYCNVYYQCVFGQKWDRICPDGTHYNQAIQSCDSIGNAACSLPGGNYVQSTSTTTAPSSTTRPPFDLLPNGCPTDHSLHWLVPHEDCTKYYACVWGGLIEMPCSGGLHFNPVTQQCDNPATAGCANNPCNNCGTCGNDPDEDCSQEGQQPPSSEEDLPPGGDDPCGGPGNECPPAPPASSSEEDLPPGGDDPCGGPGNECPLPPPCGGPGNECPPAPPASSSEEDLPPGGDDPCGGPGNECPPAPPASSSEEDLPPGDVPCGGPGNECPPAPPASSSEEDLPPGDVPCGGPGNECPPPPPCGGPGNECPSPPPCGGPGNECPSPPPCGGPGNECPSPPPCGGPGNECPSPPPCGGPGNECPSPPPCGGPGNECPLPPPCGGPGNECPPAPPGSSSEEDLPPGGDDPCGGPGNECPPAPPASSSEEDLPPGDVPCGGPGNECPAPPASSSEEDLPPGGDDPCGGPGNECPPAPPVSSEECAGNDCDTIEDDDCVEEKPDKKCEEDCHILPWAHEDCDKYWTCYGNKAVLIVCREGLHFNPSTSTCDFPCYAGCERDNVQATPHQKGLNLYLPWNKMDEKIKNLLKAINY